MRQSLPSKLALFCAALMLLATPLALAQSSPHHDVVINNATVMTATHGTIKNGSVSYTHLDVYKRQTQSP